MPLSGFTDRKWVGRTSAAATVLADVATAVGATSPDDLRAKLSAELTDAKVAAATSAMPAAAQTLVLAIARVLRVLINEADIGFSQPPP